MQFERNSGEQSRPTKFLTLPENAILAKSAGPRINADVKHINTIRVDMHLLTGFIRCIKFIESKSAYQTLDVHFDGSDPIRSGSG